MAKMKLNEVEMAGIRSQFADGKSLEDVKKIMPNNKSKLIEEEWAIVEVEAKEHVIKEQLDEIKAQEEEILKEEVLADGQRSSAEDVLLFRS